MNKQDENALTEAWHSDTNWLNEKIDEFFRAAQDHAYALGLKRGMNTVALSDEKIMEIAQEFGEFQYGDAQGHKRRAFARAIEAAHGIGSLCDSGMANTADVTEDMKSAVRWAPSSAYWSQKLREYFGPDARVGIDLLERQIREVQDEKAAMRARMGRLEALLDAAKKLLKELDVLREAEIDKEDWMPVNEADDELRAAIAKAEGRS